MVVVSLRHFCKNGGEKRKKWDDEDGLGGLGRLRWTVGFVVPCFGLFGLPFAARDWC